MKDYLIKKDGSGVVTLWARDRETAGLTPITPRASQELVNHSPLGFGYGYGGSGPSQLSLAILLDYFTRVGSSDPKALALEWYQLFKWAFIAELDQEKDEHVIEAASIVRWHGTKTGAGTR